jgi:hypothetical protein
MPIFAWKEISRPFSLPTPPVLGDAMEQERTSLLLAIFAGGLAIGGVHASPTDHVSNPAQARSLQADSNAPRSSGEADMELAVNSNPENPAPTVPASLPEPEATVRVALLGNWMRPQELELPGSSTLWDAAMAAGGPIQGPPGMIQVLRGNTLLLQVNLGHEASRKATLGGLGVKPGDVVFHGFPASPPSRWAKIQGGLNVATQILAIMSSLLSTYFTYNILHDQGKI